MDNENVRHPAVAGTFYPGTRDALTREIERCYQQATEGGKPPSPNPDGPRRMVGLVSPHAGYVYSGAAAARGFVRMAQDGIPDAVVILGPSHRWGSHMGSIQTTGSWVTPLGASPIAEGLAASIAEAMPGLNDGPEGFLGEHSLEVQLPFVQHLYGLEMPIVPIKMLDQGIEFARTLGDVLADTLRDANVVMIASTDMTHFQSGAVALRQDELLIGHMERLDPESMLRDQQRLDISMCGHGPVAAMMFAAKKLGATVARTIEYTNSGVVTGSQVEVVAYLALEVLKP